MKANKTKIVSGGLLALALISGLCGCQNTSAGSSTTSVGSTETNSSSEAKTLETYTRAVPSLLDMEDCPFICMTSGMSGESGIMPFDNWGASKFSKISHTFTLTIGTVGLSDDTGTDITTIISKGGLVDFASESYSDNNTGISNINIKSLVQNAGLITDDVATTIRSCNYMFKMDTTLVGNGLSDGYTGEGHAVYVWYGVTAAVGTADGYTGSGYSLPVASYAEFYVTGTLSHGASTTSICPDAGFYINSCMNENNEGWGWASHTGGTDKTVVYVTPKALKMQYLFKCVVLCSDGKISGFTSITYYTGPASVTGLTLATEDGTHLTDGTLNMAVGDVKNVIVTIAGTQLWNLEIAFGTEAIASAEINNDYKDTTALTQKVPFTALASGTTTVTVGASHSTATAAFTIVVA